MTTAAAFGDMESLKNNSEITWHRILIIREPTQKSFLPIDRPVDGDCPDDAIFQSTFVTHPC